MILQIAIVLSLSLLIPSQESHPLSKEPEPVSVAFCDLVRAPEGYHGKIIRTRAVLATGPESMELYAPECSKEETSTWLEWKGYEQAYTVAPKSMKRALRKYLDGERRAWVDVVGRFDGKPQEAKVPDNASPEVAEVLRSARSGYGHMGWYRFQLTPTRFENVGKVEKSVKWPKQL